MKVLDSGHRYELASLDGPPVELQFVKRVGEKYPGNDSAYHGTIIQEVCRALIDRLKYVNGQQSAAENYQAITFLRSTIYVLEQRAARLGDYALPASVCTVKGLEHIEPCAEHLHIECGKCKAEGE